MSDDMAPSDNARQREQARTVRQLLLRHMPRAVEPPEPRTDPLTVGDVAARLQSEEAVAGLALITDRETNRALLSNQTPLPLPLTESALRALIDRLAAGGSDRYWEGFRRSAIRMAVATQRGRAELAAARQQGPQTQRTRRPRGSAGEDAR